MNIKSDGNHDERVLGDLLLQKRSASTISLILLFVLLIFTLIIGVYVSISINASYTDIIQLVAFLLIVFLVPITLKYRRKISIYDNGVAVTTAFKKHFILYKELASVRFLIKRGTFVPNTIVFAFLPIIDDEVKIAISGSSHSVMEIAQIMERVIQSYPDIQMYGDTITINSYGTHITVEERKGIVNKKIKF